MQPIIRSEKLSQVHSDIRGPVYVEAMKMIAEGTPVLRLNTGNPATFGFTMPPSVRHALLENADKAVGYCDFRGMPAARQAILEYETGKGIQGLTPDDIFVGNGVSEMAQFAITTLLNYGDEILLPSPSYSLWTNVTLIAGAKPVFYTCDEASDWYPDVADIRRKSPPAPVPSSSSIPITPLARCTPANCWSRLWRSPGKRNLSSSRMRSTTAWSWTARSMSPPLPSARISRSSPSMAFPKAT